MNLTQLLEENIRTYGDYPLLYDLDKHYTNIEVKQHAMKIAAGLNSLGITAGDRVIVCMPNCPEVLFCYQGITRAGAIIVPVMFTLHPREIHFIAANCGAKAVITSSLVRNKIEEGMMGLKESPILISIDEAENDKTVNLSQLMNESIQTDIMEYEPNEEETAVILYTSGTTGQPKGVRQTHKNLYSNALSSFKHSESERGTTLGILPLAHAYGLTLSNIAFIAGSSIVIFPKFDPKGIFEAIEKYQVRSFSAVPAMIHALLGSPDSENYNLSSFQYIGSGSAPLPISVIQAFQQKFKADIHEGYGLSEASAIVTAQRKGMEYKPGSVGIPIPGVEVKIIAANGVELPVGQVGEVVVRGDNVTPGYYNNTEESEKAIKDGWLHTGDLGKLDEDGYLFIVDRQKDLIIRGGFNIYPRDLEEILNHHKGVSEAAIIGLPDEKMGEQVVACVVKNSESELTEQELIAYCQEHLAKNKTPTKIVFLDALPRNGVGKILKNHLRSSVSEQQSSVPNKL
ncbi:long-chain-fatty-acid--CoA ligase [Peribacillus sp. FSL H8-0477]|uniref:class I adenylate-forming enzyme family protein n=1 Tax=Peribacillus sp. FSL H8-0477 TaxID=2921388 RepID=UPI0030F62BD0